MLFLDLSHVVHDGFIVSERVSIGVNDLAGGVFSGPLDLQLIVAFIILIVSTDPVVNVYFRLSRPLSLHELALNAIIGSCQGAVHRLDILDIVELMAVF